MKVVLTKLNDEQLAFVITRLYEGELVTTPPTLQKLLYTVSLTLLLNYKLANIISLYIY